MRLPGGGAADKQTGMDSDRPTVPAVTAAEAGPAEDPDAEPAGIGTPLLRLEDERFLRGECRFVEDIAVPGETRAVFLRSPHAHARIGGLSIAEAQAMPGVLAVLTGADVVGDGLGGVPWEVRPPSDAPPESQPPLGDSSVAAPQQLIAGDTVRFCGEIVAMVVAGTEAAARDAAERIDVEFEPLPACADSAEAEAATAPALWPQAPGNCAFTIRLGDRAETDAALAQAAHVESIELESNRIFGAPIENRCYIGEYQAERDCMVLYATAGKPHSTRKTLAADIFGVPPEKIAVKVPDVGGGFGIKNVLFPEECLVLWAARRLGRPVKWIGGRGDGGILAVRVHSTGNLGAYLAPRGVVSLRNSGYVLGNVYGAAAIDYEMRAFHSNTAPTCNFRGAGEPEGVNIVERLIDAAARRLGRDPVELRRRNLLPPDALPRTNPAGLVQDTGDYRALLDAALEMADRAGFAARRRQSEAQGLRRGFGIAMHVYMAGFNFTETTRLVVGADGGIELLIGAQSGGQGHATTFAQVAAAHLGIDPARIRVVQGDTDRIETGSGTGASRSLTIGGTSALLAADALVETGRERAAQALEAAAGDVTYARGVFEIAGTDRRIDLAALAGLAARDGEALDAAASYRPEHGTSAAGCNICEVQVDPETGAVTLDRYVIAQDAGRIVNPVVVEGQIHGGVATGIGQALLEHAIYEPGSAQLLTGSFMDYALPRAADVPPLGLLLHEVPSAHNPLGAKGIGEAGGVGTAPAVVNAILDALAPLGVRHIDMPATPHRVWRAIRQACAKAETAEAADA
ncbi:MAG: xanthine dehydrogenase family protein molybdopterin-binding subunit [Rhodospirillaceae bacterium]|nr:xanthine dehydrogenase family protein molybdopterin-binding subunit [Rhodospirillaceae bacterium]